MALGLDAIRARAEVARQAAASGTTGTPPNVDGLSIHDALDIFAESAEDVPALLDEVKRLASLLAYARESRDAYAATLDRVREMADSAPPLMTKSGYVAGVVSASALLAAIEGTDS